MRDSIPTSIVISQPRFAPALNYLHRMMLSDIFVYLDTVQYTRRDWENRNRIKGPNGEILLTVPVIQRQRDQKISETRIDNSQNWRQKHLKTLQQSYSKAKFFDQHMPLLEEILASDWEYLIDLNESIINYACQYLEIECRFVRASELAVDGVGEPLLIDICKKLGADTYVSGSLGRNYIDPHVWQENHIRLLFHDYEYPQYSQLHGKFLPWMSFIDLFMNCGKKSREIISYDGSETLKKL
jgi:hypothetical protein